MKLYSIYKKSSSGSKRALVDSCVRDTDIGYIIAEDAAAFLRKHIGTKKYGRDIAAGMTAENETSWELYFEDIEFPIYEVKHTQG
jgi:hypothetical protein